MSWIQILLFAVVLDYFIGDPYSIWSRYPHPAVLMGKVIEWFDEKFNQGALLKAKGIFTIIALAILAFMFGWFVHWLPDFGLIELIIVTILLAHNSLIEHVKEVANGLRASIRTGREMVARIVGRDTEELDESGVARAAVESAAENFSDGVIAPIFWYLIFGLPGLVMYKMVNTADSMIGHQSNKYRDFGYGAAKLDDILNFIPARICGAIICLVKRSPTSFEIMKSDAYLHVSPNAGWPESAMAGVLDVALAGPRSYDGRMTDDVFINVSGRKKMNAKDIDEAIRVLNQTWIAVVAFLAFIAFFAWLL